MVNKIKIELHNKFLSDGWKEITDKQKNGELYLLLVLDHDAFGYDDSNISRVIGFNQYDDTGEDIWNLSGWDWCQDYFLDVTNTNAKPIYYIELPKGYSLNSSELFEHD